MNRANLILGVRRLTRDFTNSIFREIDIIEFINEGINRFRQTIPQLKAMKQLTTNTVEVELLPDEYHNLIIMFASSRCYFQDERQYQASILMNEFESKLDELKNAIESGDVIILNTSGVKVEADLNIEYVETESYWGDNHTGVFETQDIDLGVEGVE